MDILKVGELFGARRGDWKADWGIEIPREFGEALAGPGG